MSSSRMSFRNSKVAVLSSYPRSSYDLPLMASVYPVKLKFIRTG